MPWWLPVDLPNISAIIDRLETWLVSIERSFQGLSVAIKTVRIDEELMEIWPNEVCDIVLILYYGFLSRRTKHSLSSLTVVSLVSLLLISIPLSFKREVYPISTCLSFFILKIISGILIISTLWSQHSYLILSYSHFSMQKSPNTCCMVHIVLTIPKPSVWSIENVVNTFPRTLEREQVRLRRAIHSMLGLTMTWFLNAMGLDSPINMWSLTVLNFFFSLIVILILRSLC